MRTFHALMIICTSIHQRGASIPSEMSPEMLASAMNDAAMLGRDLETWSGGQATVDTTIMVWPYTIGEESFRDYAPLIVYPNPNVVAETVGADGQYDCVNVMSDYAVPSQTNFRGIQHQNGWWTLAGDREARAINIHEFGHWIEWRLKQLEYLNWPDCGQGPDALNSIHCNATYGFQTNLQPGWLRGFFTGTLHGGVGVNADGWALPTPIERGLRTLPDPDDAVMAPWNERRVIRIPVTT